MALAEKDIDALAERILHGAQERYVAELSEAIEKNLAELARRGWTAAALEQLALIVPETAADILAKHQDAVSESVVSEISRILEASSEDDDAALRAVYGTGAASAAASWLPTGASRHFREMALQAARGLADIIRRQNVILSETATRTWYEVAGEAITAANLGLTPYDRLLAEATVKLADTGITVVEYGHGGQRTVSNMVDVAVRRHIVTQVSQAAGRMTIDRMRAYGHRLVVTSSHYGARPSHAEWQGLPCAIDGEAIVDGVRYPDIVELTGYGTVGGLKGANCRHNISPYFPGITTLPAREWPEHEAHFGCSSEAYYEATQRQRELERRIRKTKREIAALEGNGIGLEDPTYVQKRLLLGNQQRTLAKWCDEKKLVRQYAREKAYGVSKQPRALRSAPRNKGRLRRGEYPASQEEIDALLAGALAGVKFSASPRYNPRIVTPGRTDVGYNETGSKCIKRMDIGKQYSPDKKALIDTLLHEELEARIWLNRHSKELYWELNSASDRERHAYIQKIIDRFMELKGIE